MSLAVEIHPFGAFVPKNAKCIVLGTFPTLAKNWRFNSFYPGRSNFFWRMLSEIYKHPFKHISGDEAAKERLALCEKKGIAITDTIHSIQRKVATSSKDSDLIVVKRMDILKILKDNPTIGTVILAGSSGLVSAHKVFYEHLEEFKIPYQVTPSTPPIHGWFNLNGKKISTHTLYSTSGINIGRYKQALEQFRKVLPK